MADEKKRYRVEAAGAYFDGQLYGQGQFIECEPKFASKTWTEVDKDGNPVEKPAEVGTPKPAPAYPAAGTTEDGDPKTFFGASRSAKRRGEE